MSRNRNVPTLKPVAEYEVAPHRYLFSGLDESYKDAPSWSEFMAGCPYKAGDVVYIDHCGEARKAYIDHVYVDRDQYGDRREKFRVHIANKNGLVFAKNWTYAFPGYIQRGYKIAGLAPDVL